ncbi:hypothetical protein ACET3Z_004152 [Daucus carota]
MITRKRKNKDGASSSGTINKSDDLFSSLPDNVFTVIFSFLTMREAFYACISCKKLKHLVTLIPYVEFNEKENDCFTDKEEFVQSVSRFLQNHGCLIKKFELAFDPLGKVYSSSVSDWLSSVAKKGIEEVDLMLGGTKNFIIPSSDLLTAATLKVLKLRNFTVDETSITGFKNLKSLLLESMNVPDSVMGLITFHCESLQHLTLDNCSGFTEIKIVDPRSNIETLILINCCIDDFFWLNVVSLKKLVIRQRIMNFLVQGSPHVDNLILYREAELPITWQESERVKEHIIESLGNVKSLQLGGWAFECLAGHWSNHQFTKLEEILLLDFNVCLKNTAALTKLISQAVGVNKLLISINQNSAGDHGIYTDRNFESVLANFSDDEYVKQPKNALSNNSSLRNSTIRVVKILGFTGTIYELCHIKFMLAHFRLLRLFKVTPIKDTDEDQSRAYAKLISSYPRVSADVDILMGSEEFNLEN